MITTKEVTAALIESQHGWAVKEQFEDTWDDTEFDKCNINALMLIQRTIRELFKSDILNEQANDELEDYIVELSNYLTK